MGRTASSLDGRFPPQGGGRSPRRVDPMVGRKTEWPLGKMIVVVVAAAAAVVVLTAACGDGGGGGVGGRGLYWGQWW